MKSRPMLRAARGLAALLAGGAVLLVLATPTARAVEPIAVTIEQPLRDPWVPPAARKPSTTPPTEGAALRAQVEAKLKQAFDAADVTHSGALTRPQAAAAGLGFIAQHFDAIDRQKTGAVRFEDVKRYLVEQGAALN
jgi:hypothetical protein